MKLLALDPSSSVGHALFDGIGAPKLGTLLLRGDLARKLGEFMTWLDAMHGVHDLEALAWERPILKPTDTVDLLELLFGLVGICYGFVGKHHLRWREVTIYQVKETLTGSAKADKTAMIAAAMKIGWRPASDHEADAGAVGIFAMNVLCPRVAA